MTNTKEIHLIKYAWKHPFEQVADSSISHGPPPSPPFFPYMWTNISSQRERWNFPQPAAHRARFIWFSVWLFGLLAEYFIGFGLCSLGIYIRDPLWSPGGVIMWIYCPLSNLSGFQWTKKLIIGCFSWTYYTFGLVTDPHMRKFYPRISHNCQWWFFGCFPGS